MLDAVHIDTILELHQLAGAAPPRHPLLSLVRVEDHATGPDFPRLMSYGFYTIGMKQNVPNGLYYGRGKYDFKDGTLTFTAPHQVVGHDPQLDQITGWMLMFHKSLLAGHPLFSQLEQFGFFQYEVNEALHLSAEEEQTMNGVFGNIATESQRPVDRHSKQVLIANLELLLTYANRFYARQFITRLDADRSVLTKFTTILAEQCSTTALEQKGIPSVQSVAQQMHLSPNYLSDLLKSATGKSTQDHIHQYLIDLAKSRLLGSEASVSEIAYELGFDYPQYFSRLFKSKVGLAPGAWRKANTSTI
ncbi:MAG: AraC family transcriptional regulator [Bacteroidota bacterium]